MAASRRRPCSRSAASASIGPAPLLPRITVSACIIAGDDTSQAIMRAGKEPKALCIVRMLSSAV